VVLVKVNDNGGARFDFILVELEVKVHSSSWKRRINRIHQVAEAPLDQLVDVSEKSK
jgi:hypothetical protein